MFTRTTTSLAALVAGPLLALAGTADAQTPSSPYVPQTGPVKPLPVPQQRVYTSVGVFHDTDLSAISGVDMLLEPDGHPAVLATTGALGNTEFYEIKNGTSVRCTLQETPVDGGVALGVKTGFQVKATGDGILSYAKDFTQPTAHSLTIDDDGTKEKRYFPEDRPFPFWDVNVPAKSGVKFDADIGMLLNKKVVNEVLSYYGYPGDTSDYSRGLLMRVNTPGGAKLGDDGVGLVMHNFGPTDYNAQQLDVVHFAPASQPAPATADATRVRSEDEVDRPAVDNAALVANFTVAYKSLDSDSHALYYLGGDMPEGYVFMLWRDGKESDYSEIASYELDTPTFEGEKGTGIDTVDLTGDGEPTSFLANCTDCTPGPVFTDPTWTCTPGGVSGWTSFWWFGCPGDGAAVGGATCEQYYRPITPIFCDSSGSIKLCTTESKTVSYKAKFGDAEVGTSVTIAKQTCVTTNVDEGDNGCGECVRMNGVGLICRQEWANWDDVTCNEGGYCFGHTWTKDCHEYDPIFTYCYDSKVTVTRCSRG